MFDEVIVCSNCKGKDCRVEEIKEQEEISMEEYARRRLVKSGGYTISALFNTTTRRFLITCQDCGHQHEFMERAEPPPQIFNAEGDHHGS